MKEGGYLVPEKMDVIEKTPGISGWLARYIHHCLQQWTWRFNEYMNRAYKRGWEKTGEYNVIDELLRAAGKTRKDLKGLEEVE